MNKSELQVTRVGTRSAATFDLPGSAEHVVDAVRTVAERGGRFRLINASADGATLLTRVSWRAWGGVLTLGFTSAGDDSVHVTSAWVPAVSFTVIDWGQGRKDLEKLHRELLLAAGPRG
ncbi:MAG: hypothetical protein PIR02_03090 [Microbacterium enclense]